MGGMYSVYGTVVAFLRSLPPRARGSMFAIVVFAFAALWGEGVVLRYRISGIPVAETPYNRVDIKNCLHPPMTRIRVADGSDAGGGKTRIAILGTDNLGRDVLSRLVQGARIAFHVGIITSLIAIPFGTILGLLAGYHGGRIDAFCTWLSATIAAIPSLLLILAIALVVGKGLMGVFIGISVTTWVGLYRTVRAEVIKHRGLGYAQSANALGYSDLRVMFRHILPNISHIIIVAFSLRFPASVGTEVFISFLGIGAQDEPSWGRMISNARTMLWNGVWWEFAAVTIALFALVLAFNRLGDALRDHLDPTMRRG